MKKYFIAGCIIFFNTAVFSTSDPVNQLSEKFIKTFQEAVTKTADRKVCPIVTQDLLAMTLHTSHGAQHRFVMKKDLFKMLAEISHIPLTIHNIISKHDWKFHESSKRDLDNYRELLNEIAPALENSIPDEALKKTFRQITGLSTAYLVSISTKQSIDKAEFLHYASAIRPWVEKNLHAGASTQIQQFHNQMKQWKNQYPEEQWNCLKIAILGTHGPRTGYVLKQYFQALRQEPAYEKEVIYVEFPEISDIYTDRTKSVSLAIHAIMSNSYQLELGKNLLNNPAYLQEDVMATAGRDILKKMQETGEMWE